MPLWIASSRPLLAMTISYAVPIRSHASRVRNRNARSQSSGSTFTKAWAWFEPTQNDTGVVELST